MRTSLYLITIFLLLISCTASTETRNLPDLLQDSPYIEGRAEYIASPFVTAGDRVYMVGHQDGTFPELGWHIEGEMGGIWNHPIKLLDGFAASIQLDNTVTELDSARSFTNFPMANMHRYTPVQDVEIERWQVIPDGLPGVAVQYILKNNSTEEKDGYFTLLAYPDLRPTWLGEETGMEDGEDEARFLEELAAWLVSDEGSPWYLLFGANQLNFEQHELESPYKGKGMGLSLIYELDLDPGEEISFTFVFAGSAGDQEEALDAYQTIHAQLGQLVLEKIDRYDKIASTARIDIPDKRLQQTFEWLKYNADWLVRRVPGVGAGIGAGIPDYPWWFGVDSEYALKGYMAVGLQDPVYETIALLDSVSMAVNGNGRIIHEMSTNGKVFNPGNINETPQFASLVWDIFKWNGDMEFLRTYFPTIEAGMDWLLTTQDEDGNLFPDGFGMMEIHGMDSEMVDVAAYTQRALADAAKMASLLGKDELSTEYAGKAEALKAKINTEFWSEKFNSYADFIGTGKQALKLIEDAIVRADTLNKPWAVAELKETKNEILRSGSLDQSRPYVLHHNWVVNTPMEMGIADTARALKALETAEKYVNPFGVFVTGIDRDESAGQDAGSFKGSKVFSYTGAVMTLPTGVQAIAENNYGRPDRALEYLQRLSSSFSYALPGSMYEVSPDYGMMTQAWNIYAIAVPIIQQFFGIQPMSHEKTVTISPQIPSSWDQASIENVTMADQELSLSFERSGNISEYQIDLRENGWKIRFVAPPGHSIEVIQGNTSPEEVYGREALIAAGKTLKVRVRKD